MRIKRTVFLWIIGILGIVIGLFYALFGNFNIFNIDKATQYVYYVDEIVQKENYDGFKIVNNRWIAESDDANFWLKLPKKNRVKEIILDVENLNLNNVGQIYYSYTDEMKGDKYWEFSIREGENIVSIEDSDEINYLRFDLTDEKGEEIDLKEIQIISTNERQMQYYIFSIVLILLYMGAVFFIINKQYIKNYIVKNPRLKNKVELADQVISLAISDFKGRFSGSYLGLFWGVIQPLSTILLFWFVFQVGFRSNPIDNVPFILWLAAGMIPWNYFYDAWFGGTNAFVAYSYIVKKVVFKIQVLPLVKILSSSILNLIFNGILIVIYCIYGRFMGLHIFDMLYFSFCLFVLSLGLSYITSTLNVFVKDVGQFMGIVLQVLMWITPMMWSYDMIPEKYSWFYKLNPLHYVLNGYRESLINGRWFFYHWVQMIWFWVVTLAILLIGKKLMNKMQDHFADVL